MSTRYLKRLFNPRSIVIIGASERLNNMGGVVLQNLQEGGYKGQLAVVHPDGHGEVFGVPAFTEVSALDWVVDLAIICSPPATVPGMVEVLGQQGVKAAMILTGGLSRDVGADGKSQRDAIREAAEPYGIRILGPDCMGMLAPWQSINASYSHLNIQKGKVSYIGQSGLLGTAMIDWANGQGIGFSHFLTLGDGVDVDLASIIDYLAQDPHTQAILLQMDHLIGSSRDFISALRAASRNKLVLVLKSNMVFAEDRLQAPAPGIAHEDLVYNAALSRAGAVRVDTSDQLFNALETLSRMKTMRGERLAIVCNGMGPSALAVDRLRKRGGRLADLTPATVTALQEVLPGSWSGRNPIDLSAEATPECFARAVQLLTKDDQVDVVLVVHAPTRLASGADTAEAVIAVAKKTVRNVLTCWMGRSTAIDCRNLFNDAGMTTFITPEEAVDAFMYMVDFHRNQSAMKQTPLPYITQNRENHIRAKHLLEVASAKGRSFLRHSEACELLDQYNIPVVKSWYADDIEEAVQASQQFDRPAAIKVLHDQNAQPYCYDEKSQQRWQDLALDLENEQEVRQAAVRLAYRARERCPETGALGFCVQPMQRGKQSILINLGISRDPVFGPVIIFGVGGYTVDVIADRRVMLPPLNLSLARQLICQSRAWQVLQENSHRPHSDLEQLCEVLLSLSQMAVELPHLQAVEINPLMINKQGVLAVDVSVSLGEPAPLAISPYPKHLREEVSLKGGRTVEIRPIRGEDEPNHLMFYNSLSAESIRLRYFYNRGVPDHLELANWTQIDYDREMAFIATAWKADGSGWETLGVVRAVTDADNVRAEFSVVIRDELQGEGLGRILMQKVIDYCRSRGTLLLMGSTLVSNKGMQGLARHLGFNNRYNMDEDAIEMEMLLNEPEQDWQKQRLKH
ncbi:GNAT family N-acetyltransferase [Aliamphritea spongicola]|uniref:GNAT family N-acetyltransferase n=1 Tax=Aliamphritea spongicola TaxID=707589 RepID=UPI00196A5FF9|nr:bifunctional acetate--CoA ligase family protein/GNAT family N-acetyltransferase [Aliamphritea spongicola]